jgi:hypothetical protein
MKISANKSGSGSTGGTPSYTLKKTSTNSTAVLRNGKTIGAKVVGPKGKVNTISAMNKGDNVAMRVKNTNKRVNNAFTQAKKQKNAK